MKRVFAFLCVGTFLLALAACGKPENETSSTVSGDIPSSSQSAVETESDSSGVIFPSHSESGKETISSPEIPGIPVSSQDTESTVSTVSSGQTSKNSASSFASSAASGSSSSRNQNSQATDSSQTTAGSDSSDSSDSVSSSTNSAVDYVPSANETPFIPIR